MKLDRRARGDEAPTPAPAFPSPLRARDAALRIRSLSPVASRWAVFAPLGIAVLLAVTFTVSYVAIAIARIGYPFELEWMEGGTVDHVRRVLEGKPLYTGPSLEFVPYIYQPLYFYVSALFSRVTGEGFAPLRLVSLLSSLGSFTLIYLFINRETRNRVAALLGMGLFAATFELGGAWFDLARVDSLFLFLLLAGAYLLRHGGSPITCVAAGLLLSLSYFTKQSALLVALPLVAWSLAFQGKRGAPLAATVAVFVGGGTVLLNAIHGGWYNYYVYVLPQQHDIVKGLLLGFWADDLLRPLPIAIALALFYVVAQVASPDRKGLAFYALLAGGLIGGAWLSRLHSGGWLNVLVPAYAGIALLFGLGTGAFWHLLRSKAPSVVGPGLALIGIAATVQFAGLIYDPANYVPNAADREAGQQLMALVGSVDGDVFMPDHGYLSSRVGKKTYAHSMAISDILRGDDSAIKSRLIMEIRRAIQQRQFGAIILDGPLQDYSYFAGDIEQGYQLQGQVFPDDSVFWPVTGLRTRPQQVYTPRQP